MTTRSGGRTSRARWLAWLAVAGLTTAALFAPVATSAAGHLNPTDDAKDCPDGLVGFKIDETADDLEPGVYMHGGYSVEIYDVVESDEGEVIAFSFKDADPDVWYVFVKGGQADGNYDYRPTGADADEGLELDNQKGISHISFCYGEAEPTPTPTDEPTPTPTEEPTPTPTEEPTPTPTVPPTEEPTPTPTVPPTEEPTPTPTPEGSVAPTESTPPTDAPTATPTGDVGGATGTPATTLPPTDALDGTSSPGESWRLIVLAMAGILAAALLLTPARVVRTADRD
jgi:hypothetical protein